MKGEDSNDTNKKEWKRGRFEKRKKSIEGEYEKKKKKKIGVKNRKERENGINERIVKERTKKNEERKGGKDNFERKNLSERKSK